MQHTVLAQHFLPQSNCPPIFTSTNMACLYTIILHAGRRAADIPKHRGEDKYD